MANKPFRICSCREQITDPVTGKVTRGKLLGANCPKLKTNSKHGAWFGRYEGVADPVTGKRRQVRVGPYGTARDVEDKLREVLGLKRDGKLPADRKLLLCDYLPRWLDDVVPTLKPLTVRSYKETIDLYLAPGLGHLKLCDLSADHVAGLYAAMRKINRPESEGSKDEMLRRLVKARATVPHLGGRLANTRPLGEAGIKRRHAVLVAAMSAAVKRGLIGSNPASMVTVKASSPRPLLWTKPRTAEWARDPFYRPGPVMVWRPDQAGHFLDAVEGTDRLGVLYRIAVYFGPRREELRSLKWSDVDLEGCKIHITDGKSENASRVIVIDPGTSALLAKWRERQLFEALEQGDSWTDTGLVFTREDGAALRPAYISDHFQLLARQAGLPPCRFHDLRHGAISYQLFAGGDLKTVSQGAGHATSAFTADVYQVVIDQMAEANAVQVVELVPRRDKATEAA